MFYGVEIPGQNVAKVESTLNITDEVIRFLIIKPDFKAMAKAEVARSLKAEQAAKRGDKTEESEEED